MEDNQEYLEKSRLGFVLNFEVDRLLDTYTSPQTPAPELPKSTFKVGAVTVVLGGGSYSQFWGEGGVDLGESDYMEALTPIRASIMKAAIQRRFEWLIYDMSEKKSVMKDPIPILEIELSKNLSQIDLKELYGLIGVVPNYAKYPNDKIELLASVKFIQWANEQIKSGKEDGKNDEEAPCNVKGKLGKNMKTAFYYWMKKGIELGILNMSYPACGKFVKGIFDDFEETTAQSIAEQIKNAKYPVRKGLGDELDDALKHKYR